MQVRARWLRVSSFVRESEVHILWASTEKEQKLTKKSDQLKWYSNHSPKRWESDRHSINAALGTDKLVVKWDLTLLIGCYMRDFRGLVGRECDGYTGARVGMLIKDGGKLVLSSGVHGGPFSRWRMGRIYSLKRRHQFQRMMYWGVLAVCVTLLPPHSRNILSKLLCETVGVCRLTSPVNCLGVPICVSGAQAMNYDCS